MSKDDIMYENFIFFVGGWVGANVFDYLWALSNLTVMP